MYFTVNVGGTKFDIGEDTLNKMDYFEALLRWPSSDIFVDRCPDSFKLILDFVLYGEFPVEIVKHIGLMRTKLLSDINFYGVHETAIYFIITEHSFPYVVTTSSIRGKWGEIIKEYKRLKLKDFDVLRASLIGNNKEFKECLIRELKIKAGSFFRDGYLIKIQDHLNDFIKYIIWKDGCIVQDEFEDHCDSVLNI